MLRLIVYFGLGTRSRLHAILSACPCRVTTLAFWACSSRIGPGTRRVCKTAVGVRCVRHRIARGKPGGRAVVGSRGVAANPFSGQMSRRWAAILRGWERQSTHVGRATKDSVVVIPGHFPVAASQSIRSEPIPMSRRPPFASLAAPDSPLPMVALLPCVLRS